jgi:asparagine synthase (glutamine-hydrolysing)
MCGINGIIQLSDLIDLCDPINKMNDVIIHRGPDDDGIFYDNNVAIGMRRLSIIDLTGGKQPIFNEKKDLVIVFNGEIYNYKDIKKNLTNKGVIFKTNSDTETILKGFEYYGIDIVKKLNGMFSFIIYDIKNNKVFIARDRTGEKPLFYTKLNSKFLISSELKSIVAVLPDFGIKKPNISISALNLFFSLTYIPAPYCIYENIYKLLPGNWIELNVDNLDFSVNKYWEVDTTNDQDTIMDYKHAQKKLTNLLFDSVEKRMIADVPIGSFLSGGVDSSIITSIMAKINSGSKINTFSLISDNKNFDESDRSSSVAKHLKTIHHPLIIDIEYSKSIIGDIILNYDEPFADSSAIPTYFVSKLTSKFVKVALTGDGGDETFGGYNRYLMPAYSKKYKKIVPYKIHNKIVKPLSNLFRQKNDDRGLLFKIQKFSDSIGISENDDIINIMSLGFTNENKENLLTKSKFENTNSNVLLKILNDANAFSILDKSRYIDLKISLEGDMLTKVDRASMLASIECRAPLLDHRLIDFSYKLPSDYLIKNNETKFILKDTFKDLLPKGLFNKPKKGFGVPVGDWLRNDFKDELISLTNREYLIDQNIFNENYIKQLVDEHLKSYRDHTFKLWTIFCFQKWYKNIYENA